ALRRSPGDGRRAEELGGAQGPLDEGRGEAARGPRRGPSVRVCRLRGHHPRGQLRRRRGHRLGSRLVSPGEGRRAGRAACLLAARDGERVELYGRAGQVFTARYPEVVTALRALPLQRFVLDGEVVALDEQGRPSFQRLQNRMHLTRPPDVERARSTVPVSAIFFDALSLDGRDLRELPLAERKACLALTLPARGVIRYGDHVEAR